MQRFVLLLFLAGVTVLAGAAAQGSAEEARAAKAGRLVQFRSCGEFLDYVRPQAARLVGPYGLGGGPVMETRGGPIAVPSVPAQAAAPADKAVAGVDYSGTNVQEEGVDEPDHVKTDGKTLFVVANGRINAVDVSERQPRLLDSLKLENVWSAQLLLHGNRLLVLTYGGYVMPMLPGLARSIAPYQPSNSTLTEIDVSAPKALRVVRTLKLDGNLRRRSARRRHGANRDLVVRAAGPALRAARTRRRARRRHGSATRQSSPPRRPRAGCRSTGSGTGEPVVSSSARSSSAVRSGDRVPSRASACSPC